MFSPGRRANAMIDAIDARAQRKRAALLAAALTLAITTLFLARSCTVGVPGITGDEPHYLIMTESLLRDGDLELRDDYERDAQTYYIYGPMAPHVYNTPRGWMPYHTPGLAFLLALPYWLGHIAGARLTLCLLTFLLPWSVYLWLSTQVSRRAATWLTLGVTLSLPVAYGASFVFPDLVGGVLVATLVLFLLRAHRSGAAARTWAAFWLVTGLLLWLNVKFAAPGLVIAVGGLIVAALHGPGLGDRRTRLALSLLVAVGPLALVALYQHLFGTPLGIRGLSEIASPPTRALAIFLGLHLDQSQGMFLQHPLLLAGLAAFIPFVLTRPWLAIFWVVLYAALLVPNAMQVARFGSGGPAGRFGWTAVWLWIVPIGVVVNRYRESLERYVGPAVVSSLVWQALLAARWIALPETINAPVFDERIWARDSLFPVQLRYSFPSFYTWDFVSYVAYLPTALALVGAGLLLATGALALSPVTRRWLKGTWVTFGVVCALLLPVAPKPGHASPEELVRDRAVLRDAASQSIRRFEAERLFAAERPRDVVDDQAASGRAARALHGIQPATPLVSVPPVTAGAGEYRVDVAVRLLTSAPGIRAATLDVMIDGEERPIAGGAIFSKELSLESYSRVGFYLHLRQPQDALRFRLVAQPGVEAAVDYVELVPLLPLPGSDDERSR